jgi:hypothetical protein
MSTANLAWFKSSYSGSQGGACIEVALDWRKSSYNAGNGGDCVEIAASPTLIHVRDSKDPHGPTLTFAPAEWSAFLRLAAEVGNP